MGAFLQDLSNQLTESLVTGYGDDVILISYEQLLASHLSPGDVFFCIRENKLKKVLSAGENVKFSLIPKLYNKGVTKFFIKYKVNIENVKFLSTLFESYVNASNEEERLSLRLNFISWYSDFFWKESDTKSSSLLDLIYSLNNTLRCLIDFNITDKRQNSADFNR